MPDREKVLKGLETCYCPPSKCEDCPYNDIEKNCNDALCLDALALLKEQEAVKPKYIDGKRNHFILCGKCNTDLMRGMKYCSFCGRKVKWE